MARLRGLFYVNSYVKGKYLTHDPERVTSFNHDPQITRAIAVNILLICIKHRHVLSPMPVITLPTLLLVSGMIMSFTASRRWIFIRGYVSTGKSFICFAGFFHTIRLAKKQTSGI
ncbi:alpha/beta hydrolase [Salmonella enterica subsp. enterica]|nr:alpha/beta hydrolase [Salmonella enterica subsp. enterica]